MTQIDQLNQTSESKQPNRIYSLRRDLYPTVLCFKISIQRMRFKSILQSNTLSDLTRDKLDPKTPELQLLHKTVEMLSSRPPLTSPLEP
jgi:hypothetical protein